jgi:predicted MFS family arabinose efflux permease
MSEPARRSTVLAPALAPALVLLSAMVVLGLNMGVRQTGGLFLEPMTQDLGISRTSFALAIAIQNLVWGLLTPIVSVLADRYGAGRLLALGGVLYALGLLIMGLGQSEFSLHLGAGVFIGLGVSACGFPMVLSAVARAFSERRRSLALGVAATGGSVGQFLLLPFTQVTIGGIGWPNTLIALAALAFLIVPLAAMLTGKPETPAGETAFGGIRAAIGQARQHRGYQLLTGGFFVCGFHVAFIATHLPAYINTLEFDPLVGATALSLIGGFNIIGGLLAGYLGGRFRKKYLLSGIYLARAVVIALFLIGPKTEIAVWMFGASLGILWLATVPLTSGLVGDVFGARYLATLFGFVMFSHQIGAFLGAWLGGLSYDLTGSYTAVWVMAVALGLLATVLHWPISDRPVAQSVAPEPVTEQA